MNLTRLMRLAHGSKEIDTTLSSYSPVGKFLKATSSDKDTVRFALVSSSSNNNGQLLYAAIGSHVSVVELGKDPNPRLSICTFYRAKGSGFVSIGTDWAALLLDFSSNVHSEYTKEGHSEAGVVAAELSQLIGYEAVEKNYGADY